MVDAKIASGRENETWTSILEHFSEQKEHAGVNIWHAKILAAEWLYKGLPTERNNGGTGVGFCLLFRFSIKLRDFEGCPSILQ